MTSKSTRGQLFKGVPQYVLRTGGYSQYKTKTNILPSTWEMRKLATKVLCTCSCGTVTSGRTEACLGHMPGTCNY